jgi:hypothetical protein
MAHYPQSTSGLAYITYPVGPAVAGVTLTADGANHTKGLYSEIAASTAFACNSAVVMVTLVTNTDGTQYLFDIATGAGGAESIKLPDLLTDNPAGDASAGHGSYAFPLAIAASTRIAGRVQCSTGASVLHVAITLIAAGDTAGICSFVNYGSVTADSGGTSVDPGGSANTKGSTYSQITASTSAVTQSLTWMFSLGGNTAPQTALWAVDIATGAGGAEVVLIPDSRMSARSLVAASGVLMVAPRSYTVLTYIPASTRIAVRASSNITDATDRLFDIAMIAGTAPAEGSGGEVSHVFVG